jgi:CheY-like chemotaxis protein
MGPVAVFTADLMFGSRLLASLQADGSEVELLATQALVRERLTGAEARPEVLVVDLTDSDLHGTQAVADMKAAGMLGATATLGFFSHVEPAVRTDALAAGFDLVVPRSRMAREAPALLAGLTRAV